MSLAIDHLVIGAANLAQGVAWVQDQLGVTIPAGGVHPDMGTHNHLMQLGESVFLEVIAINSAGTKPEQPRWYGLDDPHLRKQLAKEPVLLTWVVNTGDIRTLLRRASMDFGVACPVSRGELSWLFGLPADGRLLGAGMLPYLIEWHSLQHPASGMTNCGCTLLEVEIFHPQPDWLGSALDSIGAGELVKVHALPEHDAVPCLQATIQTPAGLRTLLSSG